MTSLTHVRGKEAETFAALSKFVKSDTDRLAAIRALQRIPRAYWSKDDARSLLEIVVADVKKTAVADRTSPATLDALEFALLISLDADDRVKQPVNGELARGERVGHRIHQERHVVIDDGDAHSAVAGLAADRFDLECEFTTLSACGHCREKLGSFSLGFPAQPLGFTWKRMSGQRLSD